MVLLQNLCVVKIGCALSVIDRLFTASVVVDGIEQSVRIEERLLSVYCTTTTDSKKRTSSPGAIDFFQNAPFDKITQPKNIVYMCFLRGNVMVNPAYSRSGSKFVRSAFIRLSFIPVFPAIFFPATLVWCVFGNSTMIATQESRSKTETLKQQTTVGYQLPILQNNKTRHDADRTRINFRPSRRW